jgi:hypothetical protein
MRVQIAFDLAANGIGDFFTLDDTTKGVLDGATYLLAGDVLVDVTGTVRAVQVRRGRSRTLEKFTAGNANVTLDNRDRSYDPTNADSPYYGSLVPRKEVRIDVDGAYLFVGNVEDWNYSYSLSGDSIAEPSCVDGLAYIATQTLPAGTATSQLTGARIGAVLNTISWPAATLSISTGNATLAADVVADGANALDYLQQVALSEPGAFFMSSDGMATFLDRTDLQAPADTGVVFGDGGIPFTDIGVVYGTEEMTNQASVTWSAGTAIGGTAVADDLTSQAAYGVMESAYTTLLSSALQADDLADWLVGQYAQPRYRVDRLTVRLDGLLGSQVNDVLGLDLGSVVQVTWTPNALGSAVSQVVFIDGIEHSATPAQHDVTFTLSETQAAFILDSEEFGLLDQDSLAF